MGKKKGSGTLGSTDTGALVDAPTPGTALQSGQLQYAAQRPKEGYRWAQVPADYTESPELAAAMRRSEGQQALWGGLFSVGAEATQMGLGMLATQEARAYSQDRLAEIQRMERKPVSEEEELAIYNAIVNPTKQVAAESRQQAQKVMASAEGRITSRDFLESARLGIQEVAQAGGEAQAQKIALAEQRVAPLRKEADELRHFLWELDKEVKWEPLSKFTGNVAEVLGEIMKYAPGRDYAQDIKDMRKAGVPDDQAARAIKVADGMGKDAAKKVFKALIDNAEKGKAGTEVDEAGKIVPPKAKEAEVAKPHPDYSEDYWAKKSKEHKDIQRFRNWADDKYGLATKAKAKGLVGVDDTLDRDSTNSDSSVFKAAWKKYGNEWMLQDAKFKTGVARPGKVEVAKPDETTIGGKAVPLTDKADLAYKKSLATRAGTARPAEPKSQNQMYILWHDIPSKGEARVRAMASRKEETANPERFKWATEVIKTEGGAKEAPAVDAPVKVPQDRGVDLPTPKVGETWDIKTGQYAGRKATFQKDGSLVVEEADGRKVNVPIKSSLYAEVLKQFETK